LTLNDEPVAVSVFEKGTPHGSVKAVLATKHHLIIADFGSHTHRIVHSLNDIPKGTLSCITGAVDGDVDEIVFAYDSQRFKSKFVNESCLSRHYRAH
jgi:hypothetical protein